MSEQEVPTELSGSPFRLKSTYPPLCRVWDRENNILIFIQGIQLPLPAAVRMAARFLVIKSRVRAALRADRLRAYRWQCVMAVRDGSLRDGSLHAELTI